MKPRDPDFPEEIPAIPQPDDDPAVSSGQGLRSTDSADWVEEYPDGRPHPPGQADDEWTELDEAEPDHLASPPSQKIRSVEPTPAREFQGSTDPAQREAAKPVRTIPTYDDWAEEEVPYQPKELGVIDQFLLLLADGATVWRKVLRGVRSLLPLDLQRQLTDDILTAILLGGLMLCLALWNPLGRRATPPLATSPTPPTAGAESQGPESNLEPGITAPSLTEPAGLDAVTLAEPSPEQNLIAEIQTQVSRISRSYATGLIQSVEVNLPEQTLIVNVGENWYGLLTAQQDIVAQDIYDRAKGLAFQTLRLRDPEGVIVARNPVVGPSMVVLRRSRSTDTDLLVS
jgi:hypothetical protein